MKFRSNMIALLVAGACVAVSAPAMAHSRDSRDNRDYGYQNSGSSFNISIDLGSHPQWRPIRGTRVSEINGPRPGYDAFRYGGYYYVYDNDQWYRSHRTRGQFERIDDRSVPREFQQISRDHWQNMSWRDRNDRGNDRRNDRGNGDWGNNDRRNDRGNGDWGNNDRGNGDWGNNGRDNNDRGRGRHS